MTHNSKYSNDLRVFNKYIVDKKRKSYSPKKLTPLKGGGRKRSFDFGVADIEAGNWIDFACIGFYHELLDEYRYYESLHDFLVDVYDYAETYDVQNIFCHNGGKYDFSFLIQEAVFSDEFEVIDIIDRGSSFLSFKIVNIKNFEDNLQGYKNKTRPKIFELSFWDSLALLPFSLRKLTDSFKVESPKGDIDYTFIPEIFKNIDYSKKLFLKDDDYETLDDGTKVCKTIENYEVFYDGKRVYKLPKKHKKSLITYNDLTVYNDSKDKSDIKFHEKIYNKNDLKFYLKHDCKGLSQVLTKFYALPPIKKVGPALTIASQSIKVWRSYLKKPVSVLSKEARVIALDGFYGGRTEMFRPLFSNDYDIKKNPIGFPKSTLKEFAKQKKQTLKAFDKNSLYPSCMVYDMPISCIGSVNEGEELNLRVMGIYKCKVRVPESLLIPPLPYRHTCPVSKRSSLIFPVGEFEGTWTSYELAYAVSIGCEIIESYGGILLENGGPIFKDYVEDMYHMRLQAKKDKNEPLQLTLKLLMNNTYGRLGMRRDRSTIEIDRGQPNVEEHSEVRCPKTGKVVRLMTKKVTLDNVFTNEAIPAWITSIARVAMHKDVIMKAGFENCFYMDTDSLYTTVDLPCSNQLGELDIEDEMNSGVFILPKTYVLDGVLGKKYTTKHRMKGFSARKIKHFTVEDFMKQLNGEQVLKIQNEPKFATLKTALGKGFFLAMDNDPETNKKADVNRLRKDEDDLNYLEMKLAQFINQEAPLELIAETEKNIKRTMDRIKRRNKKLTETYGVSSRKVKARYDKRIITDDLMFTKPIKLPLENADYSEPVPQNLEMELRP
jgi:hypothetical protein